MYANANLLANKNIRVGVVRGGPSNAYDLSLKTGAKVIRALQPFFKVHDIFIDKSGRWHIDGVEKSFADISKYVDIFFNALHGTFGEDGKVQKIFDMHGVRYTGSKGLASSIALNKHLTKDLAKKAGIKTPLWQVVRSGEDVLSRATNIFKTFPQPCVVKPVSSGASIGVSVAGTVPDIVRAIEGALQYSDTVLIEEYIVGKEAHCVVIEGFRGQDLYTSMPVEIVKNIAADGASSRMGSKYAIFEPEHKALAQASGQGSQGAKTSGLASMLRAPGSFAVDENALIQDVAKKVHRELGLRHYSNCDFILSPRRGLYFLEANPFPGFHEDSLFENALRSTGATTEQFLHNLVLSLV